MVNRKSFLKGLAAGGAAVAAGSAFGHETYHAKPYGGRVTGAGKPLKDVVVTDGRTCVLTDRNGWFRLPANDKVRFVTITVPAGWRIPRHCIRFASHERQYDFELEPWAPSAKDGFSFMHIGDSEIGNDLKLERTWVERAKKFADERDAAFFVHTGDITAQMGDLHLRLMNERTVGRPVFYVVGNHDVIRETYGEEMNVYLGTLDYCGKDTAGAFALDRKTGERRWFFPTSSEVGTEVILHKGRAYVQEGNWVVHCLDAATGREIFKVDPRQAIGLIGQTLLGGMSGNTSLTMTLDEKNNRMFAGQAYLKLYAFDLDTGKIVWQPDSKRGHVLNTPSRPVLAGGNVLVASAMWDGLIGYDLATGKEIWSHRRNDSRVTSEWYASGYPWLERWGFPVLKDGLLYLVTGNEFMEVDPKTGEAKRRYTFDFSVKCFTAPIFRGERAYFGTPRNGLVCFDLKTFKPIWTSQVEEALVVYLPYENPPMKSLSSIPVFWKGLVWATAQDGAVYGWDTETGRRVHRIATGVPFLTSACVGPDDRLYTADFLGNVRCFDLNGRCAWIVVPKRRRRA